MTTVEVSAPAKINLALHVTGRRPDGYHMLDSLVVFADIADRITVSPAPVSSLHVSGPMALGVPVGQGNLVLRAAELMGATAGIQLQKHLPAAAGLGGGSADAAATLRGLSIMTGAPLPGTRAILTLGADVPLCMSNGLVRMRGIGERLDRLGEAPNLSLILVNPGVSVSTGEIFQALDFTDYAPLDDPPEEFRDARWLSWLANQRNDLELPAIQKAPVIGAVLQALRASEGCLLARMSGSGATCFAIMRDDAVRDRSATKLQRDHPDWWIKPCSENREIPT